LRVHLGDSILDAHQRHVDAAHQADDRGVVHQLDAPSQIGLVTRHLEDAMGAPALLRREAAQLAMARIGIVVVARGNLDRHAEARMRGDVVDALAVPVGNAAVAQAFDVLGSCLQAHRFLRP
jgi:hypothetical protein